MTPLEGVLVRTATEADHAPLVAAVDEWWGRRVSQQLPRLWLRHFSATSFVARPVGGAPIGFAVGFVSPDRPDVAYLHLVGVAPGNRRRGLGRLLVERFASEALARGAGAMETIAWPGDPSALAFLRAVGFVVVETAETRPLYGVPAFTDWDREGDDEALLRRAV